MRKETLIKHVIHVVQEETNIKDLKKISRERQLVDARRIAYYIFRNLHGMSFQTIADIFDKNHASVLHSLKDIEFIIKGDKEFSFIYNKCLTKLSSGEMRREEIKSEIRELARELRTIKYW